MRKGLVVVLSLLLLCWGIFLSAVADGMVIWAAQARVAHVRSIALRVSFKPTQTTSPASVPAAKAATPTPPALKGDTVKATVPVSVQGNIFFRGNPALHEIALTFDDGPHPIYTLQVLHILQTYGVRATFFCIGRQVPHYAYIVQQVSRAGDLIGDHTWDHFDMARLSLAAMRLELSRTADVIKRVTGVRSVLFRPPYGSINTAVKNASVQLGLTPVMWSVDPGDWRRPGTPAIVQSVLTHTGNGSIILMHDGGGNRSQTVQALPQIITVLRQRGYRFVTVEQLLVDSAHG